MLPSRRRAAQHSLIAGIVVLVVAFLVSRTIRARLHDDAVFLNGEAGMRYWEGALASFQRGDGFPLWDRTTCGGGPGLADPESLVLSSLFAALFRVRGDAMGRWYPTIAMTLAVAGTYLWCRRALVLGRVGSLWAGVIFVGSGFIALQTSTRMMFLPFLFLPWVLYLAREGEKSLVAACGAGLTLAAMLFEGGLLPFVQGVVALLLVTIPRFFSREHRRGAAAMLGLATVICVLVAGVKLFPVLVQLSRWPSSSPATDALQWPDFLAMFGDKERWSPLPGHAFHYSEYRAYVGPAAIGSAIAGAGAALILKPRRFGLALLLLGGLLLTRGVHAETSPYGLLYSLLPWKSLALPSRFVVIALLAMAAAGAVAIDAALVVIGKRRVLAAVLVAFAILAASDPIIESRKVFLAQGFQPWLPRGQKAGAYELVNGGRFQELPARNVGTPTCERILDTPHATGVIIGPVPQVTPESPDAGRLASIVTSQNGYSFRAEMARPAVLHVNTSWDPDWRTSVGTIRRAANAGLDLALPAGASNVTLRYSPRGLLPGIVATVTGLLLCIGIALGRVRLRRRSNARVPPTARQEDQSSK